ncbi:CinA family protein [Kaistia dalseonensis]|uniref:Nicotinamide-nucleotide amidase n=1 Tax=Kaistia dalseonensis TaxID=410840 RepID=A0ABU0H307_9HYPH|nr:CinA family protein [Kaistia dalseonensis]MCX5494106.1 CinA family protein [Kaistia dalseonensis]MDQ0436685.1 nicotinamide-nucleotide amidase [Kaistia dalseonensis]
MTDLTPLGPDAEALIKLCIARGLTVATAESCTGGLIAGTLTEISGSSAVVDRGFVTYSNGAKAAMLGVPSELIGRVGAVSEEVARAMVNGALAHSPADLAVAVTGIAGPGGGSAEKPVGLVHFAVQRRGKPERHASHVFAGLDRSGVRFATVAEALKLLRETALAEE